MNRSAKTASLDALVHEGQRATDRLRAAGERAARDADPDNDKTWVSTFTVDWLMGAAAKYDVYSRIASHITKRRENGDSDDEIIVSVRRIALRNLIGFFAVRSTSPSEAAMAMIKQETWASIVHELELEGL